MNPEPSKISADDLICHVKTQRAHLAQKLWIEKDPIVYDALKIRHDKLAKLENTIFQIAVACATAAKTQ